MCALSVLDESRAAHAYNSGDYEQALKKYEKLARIDARDCAPLYNIAQTAYKKGDLTRAQEGFTQVLNNNALSPEQYVHTAYNLGNVFVKQNKLQEALASFEDVLKKEPQHEYAKKMVEILKQKLAEQQNKQNKEDQQKPNKDQQQDQNKENKQDQQHGSGGQTRIKKISKVARKTSNLARKMIVLKMASHKKSDADQQQKPDKKSSDNTGEQKNEQQKSDADQQRNEQRNK